MRSRVLLSPAAFAAALLTAAPALGVAPSGRVIWVGLCGANHGPARQRLPTGGDEDRGRAKAGCHAMLCGARRPGRRQR